MWAADRHRRIQDLLLSHRRLTTEQLAGELGVSRETVRRDLIELERSGWLARVHGGAVPSSEAPVEPAYAQRSQTRMAQKLEIARLAASLVEPGQSCLMDAGTTTLALARELAQREGLTIFTNSVDAALLLTRQGGNEVCLLGGRLACELPATFGEQTVLEIARLRVDWALISPTAFDAANGAMNYLGSEAAVAAAMLGRARRRAMLADASKLGQFSRIQICATNEVDVLVTDAEADRALLAGLSEAGVGRVLRPED
jgi:DeoR/GlpR family transcriptional regulator of sugar metabolism